MLDGKWKHVQDPYWDRLGRVVARSGISANQITCLGTLLMFAHCAGYALHRNALWFGVGIALIELSDDLDGAVARVTGTSSAFGAYLDAVTDRYKELVVYAALGFVLQRWDLALACLSGALLTSYNKARAGMERPISNAHWPDLFERLERIVLLVVALVISHVVRGQVWAGQTVLELALMASAVLTHLTALQRFFRARRLLA